MAVPNPATDLLLDATRRMEASSWLVLGGEADLASGIATAHQTSAVRWQPMDLRERDAIDEGFGNLRIEDLGTPGDEVEAVVIATVPDRDLARRWLLTARHALTADGRLFLAGANAEGIRSVIADATRLFGPSLREDFRSKQRVALFGAGPVPAEFPAWASEPGVEPGSWQSFELDLDGTVVPLVTQAGVFAGNKVDSGTRLLLDAMPRTISGRVLDIGCGAGVIGIAAAHRGASAVDMTDVNLLAVQAARENTRRLNLTQCRVVPSDVFGALGDARYDLILSNPPFHRGKAIDYSVADRLIEEAPAYLAEGGSILVVANAFLAYGKRMERGFQSVETVLATRQYHVLRAQNPR